MKRVSIYHELVTQNTSDSWYSSFLGGIPDPHSPVWLVLALPLTFEDPLPNILGAVGGI